jgi:hypothetical protein
MKANGLLKWLVPAVLLGIVLIIGKSWVAAPDAEPAHDPDFFRELHWHDGEHRCR